MHSRSITQPIELSRPLTEAHQPDDSLLEIEVNAALSQEREKICSNIQEVLVKPMLDPLDELISPVEIIEKNEEREYILVEKGTRLTSSTLYLLLYKTHRLVLKGDTESKVAQTLTKARDLIWKLMGSRPYNTGSI